MGRSWATVEMPGTFDSPPLQGGAQQTSGEHGFESEEKVGVHQMEFRFIKLNDRPSRPGALLRTAPEMTVASAY